MSTTYQDLLRPILQQMANEGLSRKEAAKLLGVRYQVFSSLVASLGVEWPKLGGRPRKCDREKVLADYAAGVSIAEMVERHRISASRIRNLVSIAKVRRLRPAHEIDIRQTVRETALANRGKASASQIASAIGVSRNSIIGHWFRARSAGEVA